MNNDEFYIGWMPKAPATFAKQTHKVISILLVVIIITGTVLAVSQKKFSTGNFEFGKLTEVKGIYFNDPVPCLKVVNGRNIFGQLSYITIPLIGYGKFGADGALKDIQKSKNISFDQREIAMKGTLLYNDGKLLMQVDANDSFVVTIGNKTDSALLPVKTDIGEQSISGEIVDPKCFFGVMKPGQGKPHKDCAIRCILGGIPPVLKVADSKGKENYYLISGPGGEKMNEMVKNFVGEPVSLKARVVRYDDWIVLYVQDKGITRYSYLQEHFGNTFASCSETTCIK